MSRQGLFGSVVLLLGIVSAALTVSIQPAQTQPLPHLPAGGPIFERAILFSGLATDWVVHLGVFDAAVDHGYSPDVILGTSGGSLAAAIVGAYPDRRARMELLGTETFHQLVLAPQIVRRRLGPIGVRALGWIARGRGLDFRPPNLFAPAVFDVPQNLAPSHLGRPFPTGPEGPKVILIGGLVNPAFFHTTWGDSHYFTETWFTDRITAQALAGGTSVIGTAYPGSYVRPCACVQGEVTLGAAVRSSMAEPYMVSPAVVNGNYYVGGGINLWPIELARTVARRVMHARHQPLDTIKEIGSLSAFGYRQRERQKVVEAQPAEVVVDLTHPPGPDVSFWPEITGLRLVGGVPEDRTDFLRRVSALYRYGYEQGRAAFPHCCPVTARP